MLSVKRLILPLLLLMMMLSAQMVYAKPPPTEPDGTDGSEAADCSEQADYESAKYEKGGPVPSEVHGNEATDVPPAVPGNIKADVSPAVPGNEEPDEGHAGSDDKEGMPNISDDASKGTAEIPDAGAGSDFRPGTNEKAGSEERSASNGDNGTDDRSGVNTDSGIDDGDKRDGSGETLRGSEKTGSLIIYCNVKGSLGDLSRRFSYTLTLEGLDPDTEYEILNENADTGSGFSGNGFESDSEGKALLQFCLGDENCIIIRNLPFGTAFDVCEKANDHTPEYLVHEVKSVKKSGSGPSGADLSTGEIRMTYSGGNYTVDFNNSREAAPVTGLPNHGPNDSTTQLITGFALISVLIILCTRSRHMHINIDMIITDVLESSEQLKRSDIDGYKSRCDKYHCHKRRPDRCA